MSAVHDLGPATTTVAHLVLALDEPDLDRPTPNPGMDVRRLLVHLHGLSDAFAAAGRKDLGPLTDTAPDPTDSDLHPRWREDLPAALGRLAAAWREPDAWQGMTRAGGLDLPGEIAGQVALDEVVMHGWDLAVALGVPYVVADEDVEALMPFLEASQAPDDREGLFGPVVDVPADAPALHRALGLAGRDPSLTP